MASYVGKYTVQRTKNPLADDQLMSDGKETYGVTNVFRLAAQ